MCFFTRQKQSSTESVSVEIPKQNDNILRMLAEVLKFGAKVLRNFFICTAMHGRCCGRSRSRLRRGHSHRLRLCHRLRIQRWLTQRRRRLRPCRWCGTLHKLMKGHSRRRRFVPSANYIMRTNSRSSSNSSISSVCASPSCQVWHDRPDG